MGNSTPFTTEPIAGGVRYVLPRRVLGKARYAGLALAGMGLFTTLFMCLWMGLPIAGGVDLLRDGEWFGLLLIGFGLIGLFGLIPGLGMLIAGLAVFTNKTTPLVEVRDGKLIAIEKFGPIKWKRKRPMDKVRRLTIIEGLSSKRKHRSDDQPEPIELFTDDGESGELLTIEATGDGIKPLKLAPGYPAEILRPLADALAEKVNAAGPAKLFERHEAPTIKVVEAQSEPVSEPADRDRIVAADQPGDSKVVMDRHADGVTLNLPPTGIWKSAGGLFSFGLIWTLFCVVIFGGMLATMVFGEGEFESDLPGIWGPIAVVAFALVFFAVGIGMLLAGWNMGKRRAVLDVVGNTLLFSEVAPLKTRQMEWAADDLRSVAMGPSGIESNDKPIMCLLIEPMRGKAVKLMTGRSEAELAWLAALLRVELGIGESGERDVPIETDDTGRAVQPSDSMIGVDRAGDRVTFAVPARGLGKVWPMLLIGLVFFGIGVGVWVGVAGSELADGFQWSDVIEVGFISLWALLFAGAGAAMGIGGLVMAKRRYLIEVDPGTLAVERFGLFGRRRDEWPADQVRSIVVKYSGTQVGNQKYDEMVIRPAHGKACKIGNGRPTHELKWLAAALKHELGWQPPTNTNRNEPQRQ